MVTAPLWLPATLAAALLQTWRTALQQRLRGRLSLNAAAVVRYLYGVPVGLLLLAACALVVGRAPPGFDAWFVALCAAGGLAQIVGTNLLILSFGHGGFAVGRAYATTEAMQGALLAWALLGEALSPLSWLGIAVAVAGVMALSLTGARPAAPAPGARARGRLGRLLPPAALCGLGAGLGFSLTAVAIKAANLHLAALHPGAAASVPRLVLGALTTLVVTNALQTLMQGGWLLRREPGQARAVLREWRPAAAVGALSCLGSACWFTAFALAPVALVRAVGQVEILFTLAFSRFYLRERVTPAQVAGAAVVALGVLLVMVGR